MFLIHLHYFAKCRRARLDQIGSAQATKAQVTCLILGSANAPNGFVLAFHEEAVGGMIFMIRSKLWQILSSQFVFMSFHHLSSYDHICVPNARTSSEIDQGKSRRWQCSEALAWSQERFSQTDWLDQHKTTCINVSEQHFFSAWTSLEELVDFLRNWKPCYQQEHQNPDWSQQRTG